MHVLQCSSYLEQFKIWYNFIDASDFWQCKCWIGFDSISPNGRYQNDCATCRQWLLNNNPQRVIVSTIELGMTNPEHRQYHGDYITREQYQLRKLETVMWQWHASLNREAWLHAAALRAGNRELPGKNFAIQVPSFCTSTTIRKFFIQPPTVDTNHFMVGK